MAGNHQPTFGIRVRSGLFYVLSALIALPFFLFLPALLLPSNKPSFAIVGVYLRSQLWLLKITCRVTFRVEGQENLPEVACLIASQHESAWETLYFQVLMDRPVMFAKKEVFTYPIIGQIARKLGHIALDRQGSVDAMRKGFDLGREAVVSGRKLLIFPTGTRTSVSAAPLQSGIAVLYRLAGVPTLPVLLNSGQCWPANSLIKYPGEIVVRILPPIPADFERREFLDRLSEQLAQSI